jgi:hypothetical protein
MRDRVSPAEYEAEVEGKWSDALGSFLPRALIERNVADLQPPGLAGLRSPARLLLGVDWGVSYDRSAAVMIARLPVAHLNPGRVHKPIFAVVAVEIWPAGAPLADVVADLVASPGEWSVVSPESSGVGAGPAQMLRERLSKKIRAHRRIRREEGDERHLRGLTWNPVPTTAARKTEGYGWVRHLLEEGRLVLPRHPDLLRQLAALRYEIAERGLMKIEADQPAVHDDVADALMLATGPYHLKGKVACVLARAARSTEPDAAVRDSGDTVTTGAGLVIPTIPAYQSPLGPEVTEPPRLDPRDLELERVREQYRRRKRELQHERGG